MRTVSCSEPALLFYDCGKFEESEAWNNRAGKAWPEGRAWRVNREHFFTPPLPPEREPLISVIMPAYNAEAYVAEAVSSILNQTWQNFELIIVDNASTDTTYNVIQGFSDPRIRLLRNDHNLGITASTNRAIGISKGEYLALMDADDISLPDRLKAQLTFLENNREIMILGTASSMIDREGNGVQLSKQDESLLGQLLPENGLPFWNRQEREKLMKLFAEIRRQLVAKDFSAIKELDEILWSILNH